MGKTAKHKTLFGLVYRQPQLGNVPGGIYVRIGNITAAYANKALAVPVTNALAYIAGLRSVAGVNHNKRDTSESGLVFKERPELGGLPPRCKLRGIWAAKA